MRSEQIQIPVEARWPTPTEGEVKYGIPPEVLEGISTWSNEKCLSKVVEEYGVEEEVATDLCTQTQKALYETPLRYILNEGLEKRMIYYVFQDRVVWAIYKRPTDGWIVVEKFPLSKWSDKMSVIDRWFSAWYCCWEKVYVEVEGFRVVNRDSYTAWR